MKRVAGADPGLLNSPAGVPLVQPTLVPRLKRRCASAYAFTLKNAHLLDVASKSAIFIGQCACVKVSATGIEPAFALPYRVRLNAYPTLGGAA